MNKINNSKIIVGISGGGDSNTLLFSLLEAGINKQNIIPTIILGLQDWNNSLNRARYICSEVGLSLNIVDAKTIGDIMGKKNKETWASDFEKAYPETDIDFVATLAIRLGLTHIAEQHKTNTIVTGLNLEDLMAESFYLTMSGIGLSPFPIRKIGNMVVWYPLYRCPKKILDACYPKISVENYKGRFPGYTKWRNIPYYMSQMLSSQVPGVEFAMIDGFSKISQKYSNNFKFYKELGFYGFQGIEQEAIVRWNKFLNM